jgi:hypothetical protein
VDAIRGHPNEPLELEILRGGGSGSSGGSGRGAKVAEGQETLVVPVTPVPGRDGRGAIGVSLYANTYIRHTKPGSVGGMCAFGGGLLVVAVCCFCPFG